MGGYSFFGRPCVWGRGFLTPNRVKDKPKFIWLFKNENQNLLNKAECGNICVCLRRLYLVCKFSLDQILRDYFYAHEYCRQVCIFCSRFILFYFTHYVIPDSHILKKVVHPLEAMKERCWMIGLHYLPYTRKRCVLPFGPLGVDSLSGKGGSHYKCWFKTHFKI